MVLDGIVTGTNTGGTVINCCSMGTLSKIKGTILDISGFISKKGTLINCYYLDGIDENIGLTPETGAIIFYRTLDGLELPENEEDYPMTTTDVVSALNDYIAHPDEGVDTTGWCMWVVGSNGLPELDFTQVWDPTAGQDGKGDFILAN